MCLPSHVLLDIAGSMLKSNECARPSEQDSFILGIRRASLSVHT